MHEFAPLSLTDCSAQVLIFFLIGLMIGYGFGLFMERTKLASPNRRLLIGFAIVIAILVLPWGIASLDAFLPCSVFGGEKIGPASLLAYYGTVISIAVAVCTLGFQIRSTMTERIDRNKPHVILMATVEKDWYVFTFLNMGNVPAFGLALENIQVLGVLNPRDTFRVYVRFEGESGYHPGREADDRIEFSDVPLKDIKANLQYDNDGFPSILHLVMYDLDGRTINSEYCRLSGYKSIYIDGTSLPQ